ncbi:hypothetical protein QWY85_09685 [Neolewinella lacunae]|uniref:Uncharacterized protein n=1 Tax=Neolewinella lacunae TaxID=1517758 RepID=A0A923PHN8_9BACT|nr:hypothetical protein [Neolewinella lacunae]MBC6994313.1 hypothetical protein [Neolewinella lacunae]MDN3634929.1 hypothetical protein [Neolewinella lacunae]
MKEGIYRYVLIETVYERGKVRGRPLAGQGLSQILRVECRRDVREEHPLGTVFKLYMKITRTAGTPFLYTHYTWAHRVMTQAEIDEFMAEIEPLEEF